MENRTAQRGRAVAVRASLHVRRARGLLVLWGTREVRAQRLLHHCCRTGHPKFDYLRTSQLSLTVVTGCVRARPVTFLADTGHLRLGPREMRPMLAGCQLGLVLDVLQLQRVALLALLEAVE